MELWMAEVALSDQQNIPDICTAIQNLFPFHLSCNQIFQPETLGVSAQMLDLVLNH